MEEKSMFGIQVMIYLILFTIAIVLVVKNGPIGGIFFYPKPVQQRVLELGLTDKETISKRKKCFFTALTIGIIILPVLFIGIWNKVTDFRTAYIQAVLMLEVMNWYDGIVVDSMWVKYSSFWIIKGTEDLPYVKSAKTVIIERTIMTLVYIIVAAVVAAMAVWIRQFMP
jgi:hypothetical protein